ncbi:MAG: hypothetical protein J6Y56_07815 [Fibrobacterales bacterium]|nr:hypothetical protein [Fibrobacterales bacterium]MBP5351851.1 hypothetical protein [Fibrobacterales bacterium]
MDKSFFSLTNIAVLALGIAVILVGFWMLSQGPVDGPKSMTVAPLLLTFGYLVVVPVAILVGRRGPEDKSGD